METDLSPPQYHSPPTTSDYSARHGLAQYPICIKSKRNCLPEDIGGIWGYGEFLEAIKDKNHPSHEELLEWVGGSFDPEEFSLIKINQKLQQVYSQ